MSQHGYLGDGYGAHGEFDDDRDDDRGRAREESGRNWRDRDRGFFFGDRSENRRGYSSSDPDDHYRSWRDRHMSELDRDYADYCREREQQFHQDFDSWRSQRHGNPQPLRTGMVQSGMSHDPTGELELSSETSVEPQNTTDPMETATLGTTSGDGRRK